MTAQWRQTDDGMWQYRGEDGYWYPGEGPGDVAAPPPSESPPASTSPVASSDALSLLPPPPGAPSPTLPPPPLAFSPTGEGRQGNKRLLIAGIGLVVVLAAVGIGVGVGTAGSGHPAANTHTQSTSPDPIQPTTTTTTVPALADTNLPVGTAAAFTKYGQPYYSVTMTQFVNPSQPDNQYVTPQNSGDIFVAAAFTITNESSSTVTDDIYNCVRIYDAAGQGFQSDFEQTASGPSFPGGEFTVAPGGTASGWVMLEVPGGAPLTTINFIPGSGYATNAAASWKVG